MTFPPNNFQVSSFSVLGLLYNWLVLATLYKKQFANWNSKWTTVSVSILLGVAIEVNLRPGVDDES